MKFRTPTLPTAPRDPNPDEGFKPSPFIKVSTMPILRERKSKVNLNTDIAPAATGTSTDGPQSATSEPLLRKKRSKSFLGGGGGHRSNAASRNASGGDATAAAAGGPMANEREDAVPSVPSMPIQFLKRKLSRPNLNNGGIGESSGGDAQEVVPPVPTAPLIKRKQSKPVLEDAEWTPGDDGRIVSKKEVLRDLLSRTGTGFKTKSSTKLDTRLAQKRSKAAAERSSPIQRKPLPGSNIERPQTSSPEGSESQGTKSFDMKRAASRSPSNKPSVDAPAIPSESPSDLAKKLLNVEQVRAMSIGAPCFSVEECNGRYKPQVIFRGSNAETSAEFPKDYQQFGHPSFAACTLGSAERKEDGESFDSNDEDSDAQKPNADLIEVPSMLGSEGVDAGAVGFEYFLQLPIADEVVRTDDSDVSDKRNLLASSPGELGLRPLNIEVLIYRLTELGQLYTASKDESADSTIAWNETKIEEMGTELFGKLLTSDQAASPAGARSLPMNTQIRALQQVLRTTRLWRDFGIVEWRTRIGQLLWEAESTDTDLQGKNIPCERDILLLQITLAAELLVRLNVVQLLANSEPILSTREMTKLEKQRTNKIHWDLLLAERFLENIDISANMTSESKNAADRSSLISAIPFLTATEGAAADDIQLLEPLLTPKHSEQQLDGLRHFSQALRWPHIDDLPRRTNDTDDLYATRKRFSRVPSTYMTPMSTPRLSTARMSRNSSFGLGLDLDTAEQPALSKTTTAENMHLVPAQGSDASNVSFDGCGWLSRSWLSGLVMPGEAASQFLISTLLENSPRAMATLSEGANPYGGFHYQGRGYWSKGSVVGRVMAAKKGATECMGWVSVPAFSEAQEDGWVNLAVKEMPDAKLKPRITNPEAVARDSDLLRNKGLLGSARQGDFAWPADDPPILGNEVICQGLSFNNSVRLPPMEGETTPQTKFIATLTFGSMIKRKLTVVELPLMYDACFISSYPCHPKTVKSTPRPAPSPKPPALSPFPLASMENKENKDPATKSELQRPKTAPGLADSGYASKQTSASTISFTPLKEDSTSSSSSPTGCSTTAIHPLHVDYHYDVVPVTTLFTAATETRPRALSSGAERLQPEVQAAAKEVMVLDCRGAEDLELFARAWCAKVGEHAIIGKTGRTCLACCVREARALGVCVVIRT